MWLCWLYEREMRCEGKKMKSGKSVNVWIHNLGLGGSLLCPVFRELSSKNWKNCNFDSYVMFHYRQTNYTPPSPLISAFAFRTSNTRWAVWSVLRRALRVSGMKRQETAGWGSEKLPVWYEKKPRSVFVPWNQGFSGKSGETQSLVCIVSWSLFRKVKEALKWTVNLPDAITNTHLHWH